MWTPEEQHFIPKTDVTWSDQHRLEPFSPYSFWVRAQQAQVSHQILWQAHMRRKD